MKIKFIIILLLFGISLAGSKDNMSFQYGILLRQTSNPDSIIVIENESIVNHRDRVKINVGYSPVSYFYVIFLDSDGIYDKLYPAEEVQAIKSKEGLQSDSLYYDTALTWVPFNDSKGFETLYFINSKDKLNDLENNLNNYQIANGRIRKKLGIKIQNILKEWPYKLDHVLFSS